MLSSAPEIGRPDLPWQAVPSGPLRTRAFDPDFSPVPAASDPPRLLLVEKDASMRHMLTQTLSTEYRVEVVGEMIEACQSAKLRPPALIVIDLYFPDTDSLTLIRAVRAEPRTALLPIIILSVSVHKELLLRCLSAGASNFLLKPFNTSELLMCARVELQLRGAHAEPPR